MRGKQYKGRKCANKINKKFRLMYADIYNLFPTIGEVNKNRKNFGMSIIKGEKMEFGKCDFEIENNKVEPREEIRGIIARTYFYMDFAYPE